MIAYWSVSVMVYLGTGGGKKEKIKKGPSHAAELQAEPLHFYFVSTIHPP